MKLYLQVQLHYAGMSGGFPLQVHFWQQILHYHDREVALDNSRPVKFAMVDGCTLSMN